MEHPEPQGLTAIEAARRLAAVGPNELPRPRGRSLGRILLETAREPMFGLLLGAAALYLVLGDLGEGLFLLAGAAASVGLVVFQEARSERALAALRDLAQPQVRVVRDGVAQRIAAREIVPDDLLLVGEGERLAADATLLSGGVLRVDESTLTGESAPVTKTAGCDLPAGALLVEGQGLARVVRTGSGTGLGRIGASLAELDEQPTPLQRTAVRLVGWLGTLAIAFCAATVAAYGLLRGDWVEGVLAGVTLAVALIPEEFPMVLAVFMALGAWRLARHHVLVRRGAVIEALGGATTLCVDKTGTLTENRMRVVRLWTAGADVPLDTGDLPTGPAADLLGHAGRASAVHPTDPMDRAIREMLPQDGAARGAEPLRSWPLRSDLMAVIQLWRDGDADLAAAKGAPEAIFRLCRLEGAAAVRLAAVVEAMAGDGLRVLGVATCRSVAFPDDPAAARFRFEGLVGFLDPLRPDASAAIQEARAAGIAVTMITGDHPQTALAIARLAGIDDSGGVLLGAEVAELPFETLRDRLRQVRVFARIQPQQKLLIVQALQANGEVVAMTGDGVNDAPALQAADIGIAMGRRGTDVAREAADLVLLDDSFASIVGGVRLGRRIFANLRRALIYITAIHVPIAGLALAPILLGLPPLLFPTHVVLLELAVDPLCAMVFEGEPSEAGAMRTPPRPRGEPLFGPRQLALAATQGAVVLAGVFGLYAWALGAQPEAEARGAAFAALVLANLVLALANAGSRTGRLFATSHLTYAVIATVTVGALVLVFNVQGLATAFRVASPRPEVLLAAVGAALLAGGWFGAMQRLRPMSAPR